MTAALAGQSAPNQVRRQARLATALTAMVIFLTGIAPLATDMYVPALPSVAGDLPATATQKQLTLTTFFVGMVLGQRPPGSFRASPAAGRW